MTTSIKKPFTIPPKPEGKPAGIGRTYEVTLKHDRHGESKIVVELTAPAWLPLKEALRNGQSVMIEDAVNVVEAARRDAASATVDFESFDSDSDYLDTLDRRSEEYRVVAVRRMGEEVKYSIEVEYLDPDGGPPSWSDYVMAVDDDSAFFYGQWEVCVNEGADPSDDFEDFVAMMSDHDIVAFWVEPVDPMELADAIMDTASTWLADGDMQEALGKLVALASYKTGSRPKYPEETSR